MTLLRLGVALALVAGCMRKPYSPAGGSRPLHLAGFYAMEETLYSGSCPAVPVRKQRMRVEVQHQPGASMLKLIDEVWPFDAQLFANGSFSTKPLKVQGTRSIRTATIAGRFTDSTFTARIDIKIQDLTTRARGDSRPVTCYYQVRWAAEKLQLSR